jgi:hypothetical protein
MPNQPLRIRIIPHKHGVLGVDDDTRLEVREDAAEVDE